MAIWPKLAVPTQDDEIEITMVSPDELDEWVTQNANQTWVKKIENIADFRAFIHKVFVRVTVISNFYMVGIVKF